MKESVQLLGSTQLPSTAPLSRFLPIYICRPLPPLPFLQGNQKAWRPVCPWSRAIHHHSPRTSSSPHLSPKLLIPEFSNSWTCVVGCSTPGGCRVFLWSIQCLGGSFLFTLPTHHSYSTTALWYVMSLCIFLMEQQYSDHIRNTVSEKG